MGGFFTPGLPLATEANLANGTPLVPVDTGIPNGQAPQSVAMPLSQLGFGGAVQALDGAGNMTLDASLGTSFSATLTGNRTLTLSNMAQNQVIQGKITQDGTGSRTLTVVAGSGGSTVVSGTPLTTTAGATDLIAIKNIGTYAAPIYAVWPVAKNFV
jgi:hypothetical protein